MSDSNLVVVVVNLGTRIWNGARPIQGIHEHIGYVTYENAEKIIIAPELTFSFKGRRLRIKHENTINKSATPKPIVRRLTPSDEKTKIIEVNYEDPFHKEEILSEDEASNFMPSTLLISGYLVKQNDEYIWVAIAKFEYIDGTLDYETVHIIPKCAIRNIRYLH